MAVYIPPLKSKAEVERRIAELSEQGVTEYFAVENGGDMHNAISLGIFKSEEAANNYLQALRDEGAALAQVGRRDHPGDCAALLVRNPDAAISARMVELAARRQRAEGEGLLQAKAGNAEDAGRNRREDTENIGLLPPLPALEFRQV